MMRRINTKSARISIAALILVVASIVLVLTRPTTTSAAATITVNDTSDAVNATDGKCTLREAIIAANTDTASGAVAGECAAGSGTDTIAFNIPGAGVKTIMRTSALPTITAPVIIDGYTQPGASANTNALNAGINAVVLIELSGTNGDGIGGLRVNASGSVIRGLNIHGSGDEITVNASNVTIAGNFLGTNPAGTAEGCCGGFGIRQEAGDNNIFGGPVAADRNLIAGDKQGGIALNSGNGNLIQGNYIGTDVTGTVAINAIGTREGIRGTPDSNTVIRGNLISGNSSGGVSITVNFQTLVSGVVIQGNLIGTQRDGISPLGNSFGIRPGVNGFLIGGTSPGQGNIIAFNQYGVIVSNNFVNNAILGNSIFNNEFEGIALSGGAPTPLPNDSCDTDTLPGNKGQNYPVITSASSSGGNVTISGALNSTASTTYRLEFFSNQTCDANISGASSGTNGEGQTFLGFTNVTTDASCNASFGPLSYAIPPGQTVIAATATDPAGNTSEFSACQSASPAPNFSISGQVTSNSTGLNGVTMTLSGSTSATTPTDMSGNYSFTIMGGGNYTVTPSKTNYTFTPMNRSFNNLSGNQTANFVGTGPTAANSEISGHVTDGDGNLLGGVTITLSGATPTRYAVTDGRGGYTLPNLKSSGFYIVTPSLANRLFNPPSYAFSLIGDKTDAVFTASIAPVAQRNAIDDAGFFVRQHYLDFLNREPDADGLNFWMNEIASCGSDATCIDVKRQNVSAAYFLSREFQETGFYVIKVQRVAFGRVSNDATRRITFQQFPADSQSVGKGFIDGQTGADATLDQNKTAYAQTVAGSQAFISTYPTSLSAAQFVDALYQTAGITPQGTGRQDAITAFGSGDTAGRSAALRKVAESNSVKQAEFSPAFVLLQYFGYLRRNPTDPPDNNDAGYQFWLNKLNSFGGDYIKSEMVRSFIISQEYRKRFGSQ